MRTKAGRARESWDNLRLGGSDVWVEPTYNAALCYYNSA